MTELTDAPSNPTPEAPPLNSTQAVKLDPLDFCTYERDLSRTREAGLTVQMYERELQHAQEAFAKASHEHRQHLVRLAAKHNVDLDAMIVTADGYFMPHPQQPPRR